MRAIIYCRVSTEDQVKNLSLDTQQRQCVDYCHRQGFEVGEIFIERGESAKTVNRSEFQRMLTYCRQNRGKVQFLIVYNLSRFSRQAHDHLAIRALLSGLGISLRSVNEAIDETSTGKFLESVLAAVNQLDNDMRSDRTKAGMKAALDKGRWTHQAPIGYMFGPDKSLVPDPARAELVRRGFEMLATGLHGRNEVLEVLNDQGLRTKRGKPVSPQTFAALVTKPIYTGVLVSGGQRAKGGFEPLVTEDTFARVQAVLAGRVGTNIPHLQAHPDFPLRHFLRCGECDRPMTGSKSKGQTGRYAYYHCVHCGKTRVRTERLEAEFIRLLEQIRIKPEYLVPLHKAIRNYWQRAQTGVTEQVASWRQKITELTKKKERLTDAVVDGVIDQPTYQSRLDKLNEDLTLAKIAAHECTLDELDVEGSLKMSDYILSSAARLWVELDLQGKQRLMKLLFPQGLTTKEMRIGTFTTHAVFKLLRQENPPKSNMAALTTENWKDLAAWLRAVNGVFEGQRIPALLTA